MVMKTSKFFLRDNMLTVFCATGFAPQCVDCILLVDHPGKPNVKKPFHVVSISWTRNTKTKEIIAFVENIQCDNRKQVLNWNSWTKLIDFFQQEGVIVSFDKIRQKSQIIQTHGKES